MNNYIKEIKATSVFILVIAIFTGFLYILSLPNVEIWFYKIIVGYIILCVIAGIIKLIFKGNKFLGKVVEIIFTPGWIMWMLSYFLIPFGTLFMHLLLYFTFSFASLFLILELLHRLGVFGFLSSSTLLYIQITTCVFVAVLFNYQIRKIIYKVSPARINPSEKLKPFELDKLTDYLISERNVRFLIYSAYVVILAIINFYKFQPNSSLYNNSSLDDAVLQSFITFIAFDKVLALLKELEFKPSDFLVKITSSIKNKLNDLHKEER